MNAAGLLRDCVVACWSSALGLATWTAVVDRDGPPQRAWARYCAHLDRQLSRVFVFAPGRRIAVTQVTLLAGSLVGALLTRVPVAAWSAAAIVVAFGPTAWLSRTLRRRVRLIDQQAVGFLVSAANALKSRPAVGDALTSVLGVTPDPLRQELELAVKQMRFGSSVEQALLHMNVRVASRILDTGLSAILIGRQVGGNLPAILETTAATMRELDRLEGVVRTKTAGGKAQLWVLAFFPFVLMLAFGVVSPGYFEPLTSSVAGCGVTAIAFVLWGGSIVAARRILSVDL
jgi:tight adherence protein B